MHRDTRLARIPPLPLDRATIRPYRDGEPGPFYYQRHAHPVGWEAERVLGELDGGHAVLFPSGAAATTALVLGMLAPGASVAVAAGGYYGTVGLLRDELARWGLHVSLFDQTGEPPVADLVWLEPCANPLMSFPDLDAVIAAVHDRGGRVAVDNTVLSPLLLRPLERGADFVVHSATKILAGHHDALLGAVVCAREDDHARLVAFRGASGIVAAPDPAWLLLRGLQTLALRVTRQSATAAELARRLEGHRAVVHVRYPGLADAVAARYVEAFGPLLSFDVVDGDAAATVERSLGLIENATSLGGDGDHTRGSQPLGGRAGARGAAPPERRVGGRGGPVGGPRACAQRLPGGHALRATGSRGSRAGSNSSSSSAALAT